MFGREEDRLPTVGEFAGQLEILRPDGGQVDRNVLAHRMQHQVQRLARPVGQRQLVRLAAVADPFAGQGQVDDVDVLTGAGQRLGEAHSVPALGHLRAGHAEPQAETACGQRVERRRRHCRHGRRPRRNLQDGAAEIDRRGLGR
jgi:hypothetical protein